MTKIYGVGIQDSKTTQFNKKVCPYYIKWKNMLRRCYDEKYIKEFPTYKDVFVCEEWLTFSNFKAWMELQEWEGKHLDKDLLSGEMKVYSPETCAFISCKLNMFLTNIKKDSILPTGVHLYKDGRYVAKCGDGNGKQQWLGYHVNLKDAELAYKTYRNSRILELIKNESDERVIKRVTKLASQI